MNRDLLIDGALKARQNAYAPYSGYKVGACLITEDGTLVDGCNIENASYGLTNCAERTAVFKAVSMGHRHIVAIAIAGGSVNDYNTDDYAYPCGACRQVLREFCCPDAKIYIAKSIDDYLECTLEELLPNSFGPDNLK